jgi:glyoxylase I family protein
MRRALGFNHIAMPTEDTEATRKFYTEVLGFKLLGAVREDRVPSVQEETTFLHTFFELDDGSCLAFFEIDGLSIGERGDGVPLWVRHFAMNVDSLDEVLSWKKRLEENGVEVLGPVDHDGLMHSIYFFDPNGLRLELTWQARPWTADDASAAEEMIQTWVAERRPTETRA